MFRGGPGGPGRGPGRGFGGFGGPGRGFGGPGRGFGGFGGRPPRFGFGGPRHGRGFGGMHFGPRYRGPGCSGCLGAFVLIAVLVIALVFGTLGFFFW